MYGQRSNGGCEGGHGVVAGCFGEDVLRPILSAEKLSMAEWDSLRPRSGTAFGHALGQPSPMLRVPRRQAPGRRGATRSVGQEER